MKAKTKRHSIGDMGVLSARPFPVEAAQNDSYDLGEIKTPAEMARADQADANPESISNASSKAIAALVGSGPRQPAPHCYTAHAIETALRGLRDHALAGDCDAMAHYGSIVFESVATLAEMLKRNPEVVRSWSKTLALAPVLAGRNIGHRKAVDQLLSDYQVSEEGRFAVNPITGAGKSDSFDSTKPIAKLAGDVVQHLNAHRLPLSVFKSPIPKWVLMASALPELTKETSDDWFEAGWECILSATASRPEENAFLWMFGKERAARGKAHVRSRIKENLKKEFRRIATLK